MALAVGVFYELFWLDLFSVGTYIPPNPLLPLFAVLSVTCALGEHNAISLSLLSVLCLPLGYLGPWVEMRHRYWQVSGYNQVQAYYTASAGTSPGSVMRLSLGRLFVVHFVLYTIPALALLAVGLILFPLFSESELELNIRWVPLWAVGSLGAVLGIKTRSAGFVFVFCCLGAACLGVLAN